MSWQHSHTRFHGKAPPPPEDGIQALQHPTGRLGRRWQALLDDAPADAKDRIRRGRNYAKRGRARALSIAPGVASAEVVAEEDFRPVLRVRPFSRAEWAQVTEAMLSDLGRLAALLEGQLAIELIDWLADNGVRLLPDWSDLSCDCDCGDYIAPCTHVATVFHVLTDAIDGDPFLLLTLRGQPRDQLLSTLRTRWGDEAPVRRRVLDTEEAAPEADWFASPSSIPDFACRVRQDVVDGAGLRALGPAPGDADLLTALLPVYRAGGRAARELIASVPERSPRRRRRPQAPAPVPVPVPVPDPSAPDEDVGPPEAGLVEPPDAAGSPATPSPDEAGDAEVRDRSASGSAAADDDASPPGPSTPEAAAPAPGDGLPPVDTHLTERLVDLIAEHDAMGSHALANALSLPVSTVRAELLALEKLGLLYRVSRDEGTGWCLG